MIHWWNDTHDGWKVSKTVGGIQKTGTNKYLPWKTSTRNIVEEEISHREIFTFPCGHEVSIFPSKPPSKIDITKKVVEIEPKDIDTLKVPKSSKLQDIELPMEDLDSPKVFESLVELSPPVELLELEDPTEELSKEDLVPIEKISETPWIEDHEELPKLEVQVEDDIQEPEEADYVIPYALKEETYSDDWLQIVVVLVL